MRRVAGVAGIAVVLALAACGAQGADGTDASGDASDGSVSDAVGCFVTLTFDPPAPQVGVNPELRAIADSQASGVLDYTWTVGHDGHNVPFTPAQPGTLSQIRFPIAEAGVYDVQVTVGGCSSAYQPITVTTPMADHLDLRLRVIPPSSLGVPPVDRVQRVYGGGDAAIAVLLDAGLAVPVQVRDGTTPVAAYLRLTPVDQLGPVTEAFASTSGTVMTQLLAQAYTVLVVPVSQSYAPKRIASWSALAAPPLAVTPGTAITGIVRAPDGSALAGATVQLTIDGVPSTYAMTSATGAFTVRASAITGAVTVAITPPTASGLPRLVATSSALDLAQALQIQYAAGLVVRDLAGRTVVRGAALPGAQVVVVGTVPAAATVRTGTGAPVPATGVVRASATADGSGALPTLRVLGAPVSAVVTAAPGDLGVAALDLTAGVPASISVPAMTAVAPRVLAPDGITAIPGAVLEAVPIGDLGSAAIVPTRFTADSSGIVHASLATGGQYQLRFRDPAGAGASVVVNAATDAVNASYALLPALQLRGTITVSNSPVALDHATIQVLCNDCTGLDRDRPLAETTSTNGQFRLSVPDPGGP